MLRKTLLAAAAALLGGLAAPRDAAAQGATPPASLMQPGQRIALGAMMGDRRIRMVMVGENGTTIDVVYDEDDPRARTQSQRVLRLENVNGMLEVIYDTAAMPMPVAGGGRVVELRNNGGGVEIVYSR